MKPRLLYAARLGMTALMSLSWPAILFADSTVPDINSTDVYMNEVLAAPPVLNPVPLSDVRVTSGPFLHAQEMDRKWLRSMDPDRYLSGFRSEAGLAPGVPRYGGWENSGCSGHAFGHFLSAASMMYASTGDNLLLEKINQSIDGLLECQKHEGTGLIAGFENSRKIFAEIKRGEIRSQGFDLNGGWVPFYTLHKELAGLVAVYRYCPEKTAGKALDVLLGLVDWIDDLTAGLSHSQMQDILHCEHGGITEALADVYAITGDEKYLRLAKKFDHDMMLRPLAAHQDSLPGKHANTQIPKIVGAMREYECSGDTCYLDIASYFWDRVVNHHSYVIGGNSEYEHFGAPDMLSTRLSDGNCETCNTYNMLKLTDMLFRHKPHGEYADYYERALYNQILASQNPDDGMVCYMSPMGAGYRKGFSLPYDSFWCCVGSGMENHAKYGNFIYFTDSKDNLVCNLFIPSEMDWKSRGIRLVQTTSFPYSDETVFRLEMDRAQRFSFFLRHPGWAKDGVTITVNGKEIETGSSPCSYIELKRKWKNGDEIHFTVRQSISSEAILGDSTQRAYLYGPVVLAALLGDTEEIPVIVTDRPSEAKSLVKAEDTSRLRFMTQTAVPIQKELIPYFETGGNRLMLYFHHYPEATWQQQLAEYRARTDKDRWIREYTVSQFTPGEMQPERDHNFRGEKTLPHEFQGRKYRESIGGWFSFEMEVAPDAANTLYCTYWGNRFENHSFDIEIDGVKIGFENIHNWGNQYVERSYSIPVELTEGKKKVTVTLRAIRDDAVAGPLFNSRIMRETL